MDRKQFIRVCCGAAGGLPLIAGFLQSCQSLYYASATRLGTRLLVPKSEFVKDGKPGRSERNFVLIETPGAAFPICLYKMGDNAYTASLLRCTHRDCELNVGGGVYTCPCHGSEFSLSGKVLEGPATEDLQTFETTTDHEHIYIHLT